MTQHHGTTILELQVRADEAMNRAVLTLIELSERSAKEAEISQLCGDDEKATEYQKKSEGLKKLADQLGRKVEEGRDSSSTVTPDKLGGCDSALAYGAGSDKFDLMAIALRAEVHEIVQDVLRGVVSESAIQGGEK